MRRSLVLADGDANLNLGGFSSESRKIFSSTTGSLPLEHRVIDAAPATPIWVMVHLRLALADSSLTTSLTSVGLVTPKPLLLFFTRKGVLSARALMA